MKRFAVASVLMSSVVLASPLHAGNAGKITDIRLPAIVNRGGNSIPLEKGTTLEEGDRMETGAKGLIKARMADNTLLAVGPKSVLTVDAYAYDAKSNTRTARMTAKWGLFRVWVTKKVKANSVFEIQTPTAVAGVRGTHFMGLVTTTTSAIASIEGRVAVRSADKNIGGEVTLLDGQGTDVGENQAPTVPGTWPNQRFFQLFQATE